MSYTGRKRKPTSQGGSETKRRKVTDEVGPPANAPRGNTVRMKNLDFGTPITTDDNAPIQGPGTRWHGANRLQLKGEDAFAQYQKDTGATIDTGVQQTLSDNSKVSLYTSRRGSIVGKLVRNEKGDIIDLVRLSSMATTAALKAPDSEFESAYEQTAQSIIEPNRGPRGGKSTANAIMMDTFKLENTESGLSPMSLQHTAGVSGTGVDKKKSDPSKELFAPTIETMKKRGGKATASNSYHSEGMGQTLSAVGGRKNEINMVTSTPNQICRNCGESFIHHGGENTVFSGMPGKKFGGQKPGVYKDPKLGPGTAIKATPLTELMKPAEKPTNMGEVANIRTYHGSGPPSGTNVGKRIKKVNPGD